MTHWDVEPLHGGRWRVYEATVQRRGDDGHDETRTGQYGGVYPTEAEAQRKADRLQRGFQT